MFMMVIIAIFVVLMVVVNVYGGGCFDGCGSGSRVKCLWPWSLQRLWSCWLVVL